MGLRYYARHILPEAGLSFARCLYKAGSEKVVWIRVLDSQLLYIFIMGGGDGPMGVLGG